MLGSKSPKCGDVRFPRRILCVNDLEPCEGYLIKGIGRVYEVVRINVAPQGFTAPYFAGYIDLDAGPRIFAQVRWSEGDAEPVNGERVAMTIDVVSDDGDVVYGPVFHRIDDATG